MLSWPKLTGAEADAANAVCRLAALAAREFNLDLAVEAAGRPPAKGEETITVALAVNGADVVLAVPSRLLHLVARSFFALGADYEVPAALIAPAFEAAVAPALARLEKAAGVNLAVSRVAAGRPKAAGDAALAFLLPSLPEHGAIVVHPPPALDLPQLRPPSWTAGDTLVFRAPVVLAEVGVAVAELEELGLGDVVLLPGLVPADPATVYLSVVPGRGIIATVDRNGLVVSQLGSLMSTNDARAPAGQKPAAAPAAGARPQPVLPPESIEELPLKLVFDFGELELTLAELKALVPGQVLKLGREPGSAVRVTVGGRRIGAGEIVEIDGRLGIRITELAGR